MNVWVEMIGADGVPQRRDVASVIRNVDGARFEDFGLTLDESKNIQRNLQAEFVQFQVDQAGRADRVCMECGRRRRIHDYRPRTVHSLLASAACASLALMVVPARQMLAKEGLKLS
jgi:hypothetical protein